MQRFRLLEIKSKLKKAMFIYWPIILTIPPLVIITNPEIIIQWMPSFLETQPQDAYENLMKIELKKVKDKRQNKTLSKKVELKILFYSSVALVSQMSVIYEIFDSLDQKLRIIQYLLYEFLDSALYYSMVGKFYNVFIK